MYPPSNQDFCEDIYVDDKPYLISDVQCYSGVPPTALFDQDSLPNALKAQALIQFTSHDTNIGPKYGVRDYHRQIKRSHHDVINTVLDKSSVQLLLKPPISVAIDFIQKLKQVYTYEVRIHFSKRATGAHTEITTVSPSSITMTSVSDDQIFYEDVVTLWRNDISIIGKNFECVTSMLPYMFTNHALERLWSRAALDGAIFHQVMAEAYLTLREHLTLVLLAHYVRDITPPSHVAVPFMNGMLILSRRRTVIPAEGKRQGLQYTRSSRGGMSTLDSIAEGLHYEYPLQSLLIGNEWFCATYMHAKDIVNPQRMAGADRHETVTADMDLTLFPYLYEQAFVPEREQVRQMIDDETARQIVLAQDDMLPRKDPFNDRYYISGKMPPEKMEATRGWMANRQNPKL